MDGQNETIILMTIEHRFEHDWNSKHALNSSIQIDFLIFAYQSKKVLISTNGNNKNKQRAEKIWKMWRNKNPHFGVLESGLFLSLHFSLSSHLSLFLSAVVVSIFVLHALLKLFIHLKFEYILFFLHIFGSWSPNQIGYFQPDDEPKCVFPSFRSIKREKTGFSWNIWLLYMFFRSVFREKACSIH